MSQMNGSELDYLNGLVKPISNPYQAAQQSGRGTFESLFEGGSQAPQNPYSGAGSYTPGSGPAALGYTQRIGNLGRFKQFARPGQVPGQGGPNAITTAGNALQHDVAAQEAAERYNHGREVAAYDETMWGIRGAPGRMQGVTDQAIAGLTDAAGQATSLGDQQVADYYNRVDRLLGDFEDTTAMQASAGLRGMSREADMRTKLANKGFDEQGSPLTAGMQADQQYQISREANQQKQEYITGLFTNFNNARAQLGTQLESIGSQVLGGQREMYGLAANLRSQAETMRSANQQFVENLTLQGNTAMAQYLTQSRYSPTSWFSGIAALWNMASAPGGRNVKLS